MTFGEALDSMKSGKRLARVYWKEHGMWLCLVQPSGFYSFDNPLIEHEIAPWIGMRIPMGRFAPWSPSHEDMLAEDWEIIHVH